MDGIVRHLSASANCFDGKSDGENLSGLLFLNFTVRLGYRLVWTKRPSTSAAAGTIYTVRWIGTESLSHHCSAITEAWSLRRRFLAHTYLGADSRDAIALANKVAGRQPTKFAAWARENFTIPAAA
jgi:hypothetical protein